MQLVSDSGVGPPSGCQMDPINDFNLGSLNYDGPMDMNYEEVRNFQGLVGLNFKTLSGSDLGRQSSCDADLSLTDAKTITNNQVVVHA